MLLSSEAEQSCIGTFGKGQLMELSASNNTLVDKAATKPRLLRRFPCLPFAPPMARFVHSDYPLVLGIGRPRRPSLCVTMCVVGRLGTALTLLQADILGPRQRPRPPTQCPWRFFTFLARAVNFGARLISRVRATATLCVASLLTPLQVSGEKGVLDYSGIILLFVTAPSSPRVPRRL